MGLCRVVYDYQSSRCGQHALDKLDDFKGYVQTDGFSGYDALFKTEDRIAVGCMAHVKRKFTDIQKMAGKKGKTPVADRIVNLIAKLYAVEKAAKEEKRSEEEIYKIRQEKSKLILDDILKYLKEQRLRAPPQGTLGKAIQYALNQWTEVVRYIDHGKLDIDNNAAERCIKPFAVGRKNWLFSITTEGAKAAANLYSLIQSAKLYDLKVFDYLRYVFEELPKADTPRKLEQLLPQYAALHLMKTN